MKRYKVAILVMLLVLFTACFTACKTPSTGSGSSGDNPNVPPVDKETTLSLETTALSLVIGDEAYIIANYEAEQGVTVSFSSENTQVVSVDENGKVLAQNVGETNVAVTYGEETVKCKITVSFGTQTPTLYFPNVVGDNITVAKMDTVNLNAQILFNGKTYEDMSVMYEYGDESVGTVENGFYNPLKIGESTVTVKVAWRGFATLSKTFTIKTISTFEFYVNDGNENYVLYNVAKIGSQTFATEIDFLVSAFENGQKLTYQVEIIQGTDIVKYENDKLKVIKERIGDAIVKVSCQDSAGTNYELFISVTVYTSAPPDCGYFDTDWIEL